MVKLLQVEVPPDNPMEGREIRPTVPVHRLGGKLTQYYDIPDFAHVEGHFLRYRWYRVVSNEDVAYCSMHPFEQATFQCPECTSCNVPVAKSFHCSQACFSDMWHFHLLLHDHHKNRPGSGPQATFVRQSGDKAWYEVGKYRNYTPTCDDANHVLEFECAVVDYKTKVDVAGEVKTVQTSRVLLATVSYYQRRLFPVHGMAEVDNVDASTASQKTYSVLSYNILSEERASRTSYESCLPLALTWPYRRHNLLREIVSYRADIICLQEVQKDHYDKFFDPKLSELGYDGLYKKKDFEVVGSKANKVECCATFYRRDCFSLLGSKSVAFDVAAQRSLIEANIPGHQMEAALNHLVKDSVALIVDLETQVDNPQVNPWDRHLLSVVNTHINADLDSTVKFWQVHTLLKEVESSIPPNGDLPIVLCGNFNSVPRSAAHLLISRGKVDVTHLDFTLDPFRILQPFNQFHHEMLLVSAYSSVLKLPRPEGYLENIMGVSTATEEPAFTSAIAGVLGTVDYIFYTANTLVVEKVLELLDANALTTSSGLPSPEWSSDHIALLAEFRFCKRRLRRSYW